MKKNLLSILPMTKKCGKTIQWFGKVFLLSDILIGVTAAIIGIVGLVMFHPKQDEGKPCKTGLQNKFLWLALLGPLYAFLTYFKNICFTGFGKMVSHVEDTSEPCEEQEA